MVRKIELLMSVGRCVTRENGFRRFHFAWAKPEIIVDTKFEVTIPLKMVADRSIKLYGMNAYLLYLSVVLNL